MRLKSTDDITLRIIRKHYIKSRIAFGGHLSTPDDTSGFGTSDNRSNETNPEEHIIDIRDNGSRDSDSNVDTAGDGTPQSPASSNDEPSRSWLRRIINYAPSININWLWQHLRPQVEDSLLLSLAGTLLQVSASTSVNSGSSSVFKVAIAVAYSASLIAVLLRSPFLVKLGAIAYTIVMYEPSVNNLPAPIMWFIAMVFLITVAIMIIV